MYPMNLETTLLKSNHRMKNIIFGLFFCLAFSASLIAQPGFYFSNEAACQGETFCVDITVDNFSNITGTTYQIRWDAAIIQYQSIQNPTLPGFNIATHVDASAAASGILSISWSVAPCGVPGTMGVTLNDCFSQCRPTIMSVCFRMLSSTYGASTTVGIGPNPYVTKDNSACQNVGLINNPGIITNCVRPVELIASRRQGNPGDLVCVDFRVTGFDDLNSMQFTVNYDSSVLTFENVVIPGALPNFSQANFGTPPNLPAGTITVSWSYTPPDNSGITLLDSTVIFQVCFRISGQCETASLITFGNSPTPIEFGNTIVQNFNIMVLPRNGRVQASNCNPTGMPMRVVCGPPRNLGETFCVDITANNFFNVAAFNYLVEWNPAILEFQSIANITTNGISNFTPANFSTANVQGGILGVNWVRTANNNAFIPNGEVHYRICFKVIGVGGNSPVSIGGPLPFMQLNNLNAPNTGINPTNCEVVVNQPTGVTLRVANADANFNQQVCVNISANNFRDITRFRFSVNWDPLHLQFVSIQNLTLPGVNPLVNFNQLGVASGTLSFDWSTMTPVTQPDGTDLFRLCFLIVGQPGDCDLVSITDVPLAREAVTSFSNGSNIGISAQDGTICSLFPEGFFMNVGTVNGLWRDTICVPFTVASFDNITEARFDVSFNPNNLSYVGVRNLANLPGLSASTFNTTQAGIGVIRFNWNSLQPRMLPDSTVLFEMCFAAIGEAGGTCHRVDIIRDPAPVVLTSAGIGSLVSRNGRVCVGDKLILESVTITPVSCPGANDGRIELTVVGGRPPYGNTWESDPLQFFPLVGRNLPVGSIVVTTRDNSSPAVIRVDTFFVPLAANVPTVDVGPDRPFPCDGSPVLGLQSQVSQGPEFAYKWTTLGGELALPDTNATGLARRQGIYILAVTNRTTGCTVTDTVLVTNPVLPIADGGPDQLTTCLSDTVRLNGSLSSTGDTVTYNWTAFNGGAIVAGEQNQASPRVRGIGTYALEVRFTTTGCVARDTVLVNDGAIPPTAFGGADAVIGCNTSITLDGSASFGANPLSLSWQNQAGATLSNTATYETSSPGTFILVARDTVNGCMARDTVVVTPTSDVPTVNAGADLTLTCNTPEVTFAASVTNSTSFAVQWTPLSSGGALVSSTETQLNARASAPGTYRVEVRDLFNQCTAADTVVVNDGTQLPDVTLATPNALTCDSTQVRVSATTPAGNNFTTRWTFNGQSIGAQTNAVNATQPGFYTIEVTNTTTGCVRLDSVEVRRDLSAPSVGIVPPATWTCRFDTVQLTSNIITGDVPGIRFVWTGANNDTTAIIGRTAQNPVVIRPGSYTVRAFNPITGCFGEATVMVQADSIRPTAQAGDDRTIGCGGETVQLRGIANTAGVNPLAFSWIGPNGTIITTQDTITVSEFGAYVFVVRDEVNGCSAADTVLISSSTNVPTVTIAPDTLRLTCTNPSVTIPGQISFNGSFTFEWISLAFGALEPGTETSQTPSTSTGGIYILRATNPANQCFASDTVVVVNDQQLPIADAGGDFTLTCREPSHRLSAQGSSTGPNIRYDWYLNDLNNLVAANTDAHTVQQPGNYILQVRNALNGCVRLDTVVISQDGTPPQVAVLTQSLELFLTCATTQVTANVAYTPNNPDFNIQWEVSQGGNIVSLSADSLTITVNLPGIYTIRVTNPENGCVGSNEVVVAIDTIRPTLIINPSPGQEITCATSVINLNASGSSTGPDFTSEWNVVSGGPLTTITPQQVTTATAGAYELVITNTSNGCVSRDTIRISENRVPPTATIAIPQPLTCNTSSVTLNGNGSSSGANFNIAWQGLEGGTVSPTGNPLQVTVTTGGLYELTVRDNTNGCEKRDTILVREDNIPPLANAGPDTEISCAGVTVTLDGSGSAAGDNINYQWSVISGGGSITGATLASASVNAAGTYQLLVTNTSNGCSARDTVVVRIANNLPDAMAGEDTQVCGGSINLRATLPPNTTGQWTSLGQAVVSNPSDPESAVTNAQTGDNRFVWTLSTADCPNYSSDTVTIRLQRAPEANNDQAMLPAGTLNVSINVAANDQLFGASAFTVTVVSPPTLGRVDSIRGGVLNYSVLPGVFGQDQLRYQICNADCPTLCDTAAVQIQIERSNVVINLPNAITPNGDGLNDQLIFEQLLDGGQQYPNNELIIFNRWNDIVFRARPYLNDWSGTNQSGQELPQGTYYYILRLNIAEGEIIRGDITIVR